MTDNSAIYYQCIHGIERARLGWLYANGTLTPDEAMQMIWECQDIAGSYALATIDVATILDNAVEQWANDPEELRPLAERACQRVYSKWAGSADEAAHDWASSLIEEYAAEDGIELVEA